MSWTGLDDFLDRAATRLDPPKGPSHLAEGGDLEHVPADLIAAIRPAAVLIGIVPRVEEPSVVLTTRPATMKSHAGQVAFPGGKIDPGDADEVAAALREAEEEVGAPVDRTDVIGRGAPYISGSAYRITPVVGLLPPDFIAKPDPLEVDEAFETPLSFLMDPANHQAREGVWKGRTRRYYEMPHNGYRIWGVTAGIIRALHDQLYRGEGG
ncbi:MAG: CoA pyrophosphatase [Pseudomonadota bacterium]